jgi:hypothetical protein
MIEEPYHDRRHRLKITLPPNVHFMNKNEAKMLRKLRAKTGLSEEVLRSFKKYRKVLSDSQDAGEKPSSHESKVAKYYKRLRKLAASNLGISQCHPDFAKKFTVWFQEYRRQHYTPWWL